MENKCENGKDDDRRNDFAITLAIFLGCLLVFSAFPHASTSLGQFIWGLCTFMLILSIPKLIIDGGELFVGSLAAGKKTAVQFIVILATPLFYLWLVNHYISKQTLQSILSQSINYGNYNVEALGIIVLFSLWVAGKMGFFKDMGPLRLYIATASVAVLVAAFVNSNNKDILFPGSYVITVCAAYVGITIRLLFERLRNVA